MTGGSNGMLRTRPEPESQWRRLTPRMLLVFPIKELGRFFPVLLGVFLLGNSSGRGRWWVAAVGVIVIATAFLRWFTTRFRITDESVEVRSGLFRRTALAASVDRVRTVEVTSNLLYRLLGLAKVEIGTASADTHNRLILDSLPRTAAQQLRVELLHRRTLTHPKPTSDESSEPPTVPAATAPTGPTSDGVAPSDTEHLIVELEPQWIKYAPLTLSGVLSGAIILGFAWRLLNETGTDIDSIIAVEQTTRSLARLSFGTAIVLVTAVLVLAVALLSVAGYVLSFWKFRLSRHDGGTLHVKRGLLTTRATSIEEARLRGIELIEPLLLRWGRAAKLTAITTGLHTGNRDSSGESGSTLLPPAPLAVARRVGGEVLRDPTVMSTVLTRHGPAAAQRRYMRALVGTVIVMTVTTLSWAPGLPLIPNSPVAVPLGSLVLIPMALVLGRDRYRSLGHQTHQRYLVRRAGSVTRRTSVVHCDGIVGWNLSQSFFQRRAGLVTLTATTAAGTQHYSMTDMDQTAAIRLAESAVPGLLRPFLA